MGELDGYPDTPLKRAMLEQGLSVRGLAKLLSPKATNDKDLDRKAVRRWLRGEGPNRESAAKLALALGVDVTSLIPKRAPAEKWTVLQLRDRLLELSVTVDDQQTTIDSLQSKVEVLERASLRKRRAAGER